MEEILQDIHEFPLEIIGGAVIRSLICLLAAYLFRPRSPTKTWWKHWKALAVVFIMIWLILSSIVMGRDFVQKENFNSLMKIEGILKHNKSEGLYLLTNGNFNVEKNFKIQVRLLDYASNVMTYENKSLTIWQKNHVAYQLEYNGNVIYSLERSNEKVWLCCVCDLVCYYVYTFCLLLWGYFMWIRTYND